MNILVSACLLGADCRYNGTSIVCEDLIKLKDTHNLIPFCAEIYGGLKTPRDPAEIINGKVITSKGVDVTENYIKGANEALKIAKLLNCEIAILKENSPSCGFYKIHNGKFDGKLIDGNGITAQLLYDNEIKIIGESEIAKTFNFK